MFFGIYVFALWTSFISTTSEKIRPHHSVRGAGNGAGNGSEVLCSEEGNCTCLFERLGVTVKCSSVGDKLDGIAFELPQTATHL